MSSNQINLSVPYYCQRDNKYIWYRKSEKDEYDKITGELKYKKDDNIPETKKPLAPITCNITSLCMILHYFGITNDSPDDMLYKIFDSEEYKNDGGFSQWRTSDYPAEDACPGTLEDRANIAYVARTLGAGEKSPSCQHGVEQEGHLLWRQGHPQNQDPRSCPRKPHLPSTTLGAGLHYSG